MALQSSGPISLLDIQNEFGGSNPIGINEYYGADTGVPASGTISFDDFYGTSSFTNFTANILLVAGGGGGGGSFYWNTFNSRFAGGGGGAGEVISNNRSVTSPGATWTITIGSGGAGGRVWASGGTDGNDSTIVSGGTTLYTANAGDGTGPLSGGTSGSGNAGGSFYYPPTTNGGSGGGGDSQTGSFGFGNSLTNGAGGGGGDGTANNFLTGSNITYGGGGGGGAGGFVTGAGGSGGGGRGGGSGGQGVDGSVNTGGGGGGMRGSTTSNFASAGGGGSGICVIRVPNSITASSTTGSPTVTTYSSYRVYKFTTSGSITW